jgi:predicted nucleotidyltransferase
MAAPNPLPLPGNPQHQRILEAIVARYADDERIVAVLVFGSLGRGNWDDYSDLDLAVVVRDDIQIDVAGEVGRLRTALAAQGERTLFTQVAGEAAYLMPESLCAIALDYLPLRSLSPYVLDGWRVLAGALDAEAIRSAAKANDAPRLAPHQQVHRALWLALGAEIALQRGHFWRALPTVERMRGALVEVYAISHGGKRAYAMLEDAASAALRAKFGRTLPAYFPDDPARSVRALGEALGALLHLIEHDLDELSNGQVELGPGERELIALLLARLATLDKTST